MKKLYIAILAALTMVTWSAQAEEAKVNFDKNCAACHGKEGKGDTPMGQKLEAKDFSDAKVQAALTDEKISKTIKEGLKKGEKVVMRPYGEKFSEDEIKALVKYVRAFKK